MTLIQIAETSNLRILSGTSGLLQGFTLTTGRSAAIADFILFAISNFLNCFLGCSLIQNKKSKLLPLPQGVTFSYIGGLLLNSSRTSSMS